MPVRVRDLEIALVLAREMKAAAARSVDASLRLDQLQEVFGVEELDRTERARIQTALQMAGLEPFPSLLEAEPSAPIRFGASKAAAVAGGGGANAAVPPESPAPPLEEPAAADAQPTFPTVGQFARSKLRRRRFGVRRGDHDDRDAQPPAAPAAEEPHAGEAPHPEEPLPAEEPLYRHGDALADAEEELTRAHEVPADYAETNGSAPDHVEALTEIHYEVEPDEPEPDDQAEAPEHEESVTDVHHEVVEEADLVDDPADESHVAEPEPEPHEEPHQEPEFEPHAEDEREYIPLVRPEQVTAAAPSPEAAAPPAPAGARTAEVVAALLPAMVIPVIVTSIAGWRFGLPFVALSVIATGILLSRRTDGERRGLFGTLRGSAGARTALMTTAVVTVLAVGASIALTVAGDKTSSGGEKAATPARKPPSAQSSAPKPVTPAPRKKKSSKPRAQKQAPPASATEPPPATTEPQPTTAEPQPDPATRGLIRVPPSSAAQSTTTTPQQTP
jgi:hypothetical protein